MPHHRDLRVDPESATPLAAQLSQQLSWLIVGGALSEGDELPAVQALAGDLGVNPHTVRAGYQQLEAAGLISMGRGRRARVRGFDRTKQPHPRSRVPSYTIGVIIAEFAEFYAPLLSAIENEASKQPALVFIANAHEDPEIAHAYLNRFAARQVDGIIVTAGDLVDGVDTSGLPPLVFIDAPRSPGPSIDYDLEGSQYLATAHLIEHGHTRIGFIAPPLWLSMVAPKLAGHLRALEEAGIEPDEHLTVQVEDFDFTSTAGAHAATRLLGSEDPPTAITTSTDAFAVGAYQTARSLGIRIPDDLAVSSNDDSPSARILDPALTTVSLPIPQAGELAVRSLSQLRNGEALPERVVLDVELITRRSCGCNQP